MNDSGANVLERALRKRPPAGEVCDFCAVPLTPEHSHLIELAARRILCSCRPCYIVFEPEGAAQGRYRPIPSRYLELDDFVLDDTQWESLAIPIGLAFFFYNSLEARTVAFYPSPAGATESTLPLEALPPVEIAPDVEAVLVRREAGESHAYIVPIDAAYELVGIIRSSWKGFDGGEEARAKIDEFFAKIAQRAQGRVTARTA